MPICWYPERQAAGEYAAKVFSAILAISCDMSVAKLVHPTDIIKESTVFHATQIVTSGLLPSDRSKKGFAISNAEFNNCHCGGTST